MPEPNINLVSWFDTMLSGIPWSLSISLIYKSASCLELKVILMASKCAALGNLSIITQMLSYYLVIFDNPIMKSTVMSSYFYNGIDNGWSNLSGF